MSTRVTIKTLAQDLGISHMTVSRALSNHPNVRRETKELVLKRAAELGYVKSAAATAMRGEGTRIVGLLLPNLVNEFYAKFANALAIHCDDRDLHLITHLTNDDPAREEISLTKLRELQAGAVVMVPTPGAPPNRPSPPNDMQIIQFIRTRADLAQGPALVVQDQTSIRAAVSHLAQTGHRDIAYIGAPAGLSSGRQRLQAYLEGLEQGGLDAQPDLLCTNAPSFEMGFECASQLFAQTHKPTALVCGGFEISNGALEAALRMGLQLPQDLAFVGYGDPGYYQWIQGGISTITLPVDSLAQKAAQLLSPDAPRASSATFEFTTSFTKRNSG